MSENREQISENPEFLVLLRRYEAMRDSEMPAFFDVDEFEQIIDYYIDEFQYEEACEAASIGNRQHPTSVELKYKFISIYIEQGKPGKALQLIDEIPAWEDGNSELHFLKGTALCMLKQFEEAEAHFDRAISLAEEDLFDALINIAIAFENAEYFPKAVKYLTIALEHDPLNLSVLFDLGYFHERVGDLEQSVSYYLRYLDQDPFSDNTWYNLGIVYHKMERFNEAIEAYDYAIALNPEYPSAYFNRANVWADMDQVEKAIACYLEFLEFEPDNLQALCFLGECYEQINDHDGALEAFRHVIEKDNTSAEGWFGAGMAFYRKEQFRESITYILKAIEFDDQNIDYWYNLGYAYEEAAMVPEAIKCFSFIVRKSPAEKEAWLLLTELMMKEGDFAKAIPVLREAYLNHPDDDSINIKLAVCHLKEGDMPLSSRFLRKALELNRLSLPEFHYYINEEQTDPVLRKIIQQFK
ncbi:MAG: tetratricopeptide repeat protein [Bacteroidales bacterium]|nr:tetratricopeptide repeat protein [Bacteroidales bacterium]